MNIEDKYSIEASARELMTLAAFVLFCAALFAFPFFEGAQVLAEKVTCSSFLTWEDAQRNYQKRLDRDGDGEACDSLKGKGRSNPSNIRLQDLNIKAS